MSITPYLLYEDLAAALTFLKRAFDFKILEKPMLGPDRKPSHAAMSFRGDMVMMGRPGGKYRNPKKLGQATQSLYINVDDADKHFKRSKRAGAKVIEEPQDTFYGHRRYGVEDPEGHQWYFAHEIKETNAKKPARATPKRK